MPDPASDSLVLYMTNIQENKLYVIKTSILRLKKKAPMDLQSVVDPDSPFHSLGAAIVKARSPKPLSLL